jgi:hypothetical protein
MRRLSEALRGARAALAARPGVFWSVTAAVAALNVFLPVAVLSAARKPVDFFTFNPWLKRLPDYLASGVPIGEMLGKLADLALFWFSADSPYGGIEWGFAVDVTDLARILLVSALFGLYFALWFHYRALGGSARQARSLRRGGVAGAAATVFGVSTGACSVMGCGAPVIPVVGLAFAGLSSGTLSLLASLSRVTTALVFVALAVAVAYLGWRAGEARGDVIRGACASPLRSPSRRPDRPGR